MIINVFGHYVAADKIMVVRNGGFILTDGTFLQVNPNLGAAEIALEINMGNLKQVAVLAEMAEKVGAVKLGGTLGAALGGAVGSDLTPEAEKALTDFSDDIVANNRKGKRNA